ncbi:MAG: CBS domain-containing protein [Nitrospiria bacterium]
MRGTDYWVGGKSITEITASHLMERDVLSFEGTASCHDLSETMVKGNFGSIPIVDNENRLIGIVTEFDLLSALLKGKEMKQTSASEVMTQPPVTIPAEMPVKEIIALLQAKHLIRVPVVDSLGRLIGLAARRDILACYLETTIGPLPSF